MVTSKRANIYDVAKYAGVSHQTVSRVLNNHPNIKISTREKVESAMRALDYRPSQAARQLVTSQSNLIGLLLFESELYGPSSILKAMERQARSAGYSVLSISILAGDPASWREGIEQLRKLEIDGLVTIALPQNLVDFVSSELPNVILVAIDTEPSDLIDIVNMDNIFGSQTATEHLIALDHTEILHVSGPPTAYEAIMRKRGYEASMKKAKLKPEVINGDWSIETGFKVGNELLKRKTLPTAIFCANDHLSLGVIKALHGAKVKIPQDVSIIGFDGIPESEYFIPALTTVRQDFNSLGKMAMSRVLAQLKNNDHHETLMIKPELIVRDSTQRLKRK